MTAMHAMTGPRKILELDGKPKGRWRLETGALHLFKGQLWSWEIAGCIICADQSEAERQTLCREDDGVEYFRCLEHGPLDRVEYVITRRCTVRIGAVEREFVDTEQDYLLFPADMEPEARTRITEAMISEAQTEAAAKDWLPVDDDA